MYCVTVAFTMTERADQLHHYNDPVHSTAVVQGLWQSITSPRSVSRFTARIWLPENSGFSQSQNRPLKEEICECKGHTIYKLNQLRLTADRLAPPESEYSRMISKVSSNWLPSYIKATRPFLEIFKMVEHFPDCPLT